jgi:opacity protein-like surface antigen
MFRTVFLILAAFTMICGVTSDADARKGFYIGVGLPYNTITGDFDGNSALQGGNEIIIVPEIDGAVGFAVMPGIGINQQWAIELHFLGSSHDGSWLGSSGDVEFFSFSINGKYNFSPSQSTQPYLLFGISSNTLVITDGSWDTLSGEVGDATFSGPGFNFGGGIEHYVDPHVSFRLGLTYRFVDYTDAEGVNQSGTIEDSLDGSGISFMVSTAYNF